MSMINLERVDFMRCAYDIRTNIEESVWEVWSCCKIRLGKDKKRVMKSELQKNACVED